MRASLQQFVTNGRWPGVVAAILVVFATVPWSVTAHGSTSGGGPDAGSALGVAVVFGLSIGLLSVRIGGGGGWIPTVSDRAVDVVLATGFLSLGGAFLVTAVDSAPSLALVATAAGSGLTALGIRAVDTRTGCQCVPGANFAVGGVAAHRVVEGVALGAAVAVGGRVGLVASALVVGHTAVEAGLLGAAYGATSQLHGVAVVVGVQLALVCGAAVGIATIENIPLIAEAIVLALAGGALVIVGGKKAHQLSLTIAR
jgi:hypothetical protein